MTSCSGTLRSFDPEFPAMDNVFGNTRAGLRRLMWCLLLLTPVFPGWLLVFLCLWALGARGCSEGSPFIPLFPSGCGLSWFQAVFCVSRQRNQLLLWLMSAFMSPSGLF